MILLPSLILLFSLVLRGRFDEPAQPQPPGEPAPGAQRPPLGIAAAVCLVLGAPLLFFSDGGVTLALGVVLLLAGLAAASAVVIGQVAGD